MAGWEEDDAFEKAEKAVDAMEDFARVAGHLPKENGRLALDALLAALGKAAAEINKGVSA